MNSKTKWILGGLAITALGAVTAGLFATEEGRQTRKKLKKQTRKLRNKTLQQVGELKVGAGRKYEAVKQAANDFIDEGKEKIASITGSGDSAETAKTAK